jgi:uncharacterized membrane protein YeaQ/YmgE (transglycosylase-associated protein family)
MLPTFGQGAAQPFEDAAALASGFALHGRDVATAMLYYERVRHFNRIHFWQSPNAKRSQAGLPPPPSPSPSSFHFIIAPNFHSADRTIDHLPRPRGTVVCLPRLNRSKKTTRRIMSIVAWIVVGIIAGWLAERITGRHHGLLTNLIVGIIGAFIGGIIFSTLLGFRYDEGFNLPSIIIATAGAVVLLAVTGRFRQRRTSP